MVTDKKRLLGRTSAEKTTAENLPAFLISRQDQMQNFIAWMDHPEAPTTVLSFVGVGGVGKTSLMTEMRVAAQNRGALAIWVDGRVCEHTPLGFLHCLTAALTLRPVGDKDRVPSSDLAPIWEATANERLLLLLDNYDELSALEGWLLESFFSLLPKSGVLIVLASRKGMSLKWRTHPEWTRRIVEREVANFSRAEAQSYLQQFDHLDAEDCANLLRMTNGYPLGLSLAVSGLRKTGVEGGVPSPDSRLVSGQFLRELTRPDLLPALDALVVVGSAHQELLAEALERPLTAHDYHQLAELSFLCSTATGLTLHDTARAYLLQDLRTREPQYLQHLQRRFVTVLCRQLQLESQTSLRQQTASRLLHVCVEASAPRSSYVDLTVDPEAYPIEPFQPRDVARLHSILGQWCEYSVDAQRPERRLLYHAFLDEACEKIPESIRVIRDDTGAVVAMFIFCLLYGETYGVLRKYFATELNACLTPAEANADVHKANTFYAVLGAADTAQSGYAGNELMGAFTRDALLQMGNNARFMLVANNAQLKSALVQAGFQMRRAPACDTSDAEAHVLDLDLREGNFAFWAKRLVGADAGSEAGGNELGRGTAGVGRKSLRSFGVSEGDIKEALLYLAHRVRFERCALAQKFSGDVEELRILLKQCLHANHVEHGLTPYQQQLLRSTYEECKGNINCAMADLHLSRATYYRHLRDAVSQLCDTVLVL